VQPWRMLARLEGDESTSAAASEALLVDYLTPMAPVRLFKAIKARHIMVATALMVSFLLEAVIILSTGLFDIEYLPIKRETPLAVLDHITGANHDFSRIGASPALIVYGVQNIGLTYPEGTTASHAAPKLAYASASNATLTTILDVFSSHLQCEQATLKVDNLTLTGEIHYAPKFNYSLETSDCRVFDQTVTGGPYLDYNLEGDNYVFSNTYGNIGAVQCSDNDSDDDGLRVRISVGMIDYNSMYLHYSELSSCQCLSSFRSFRSES
jgi:hypothetical protein